jgi:hypothetical protein
MKKHAVFRCVSCSRKRAWYLLKPVTYWGVIKIVFINRVTLIYTGKGICRISPPVGTYGVATKPVPAQAGGKVGRIT